MRIMFMAQCYAPENISAAVLITELAADLARRGHEVTVVTGAPNYPYGRLFEGYRNGFYSVEILDGVRVIRTWSYISPSKKFWPRLFHYGSYSATSFYGGWFAGRPDVIVSYSPPLPLGLSAWLLSLIFRVPWLLQIEDLFPDAAVAAGIITNKRAIGFFRGMENFLYRNARRISVISKNYRQILLSKGVIDSKIEVIPVWADPAAIRPMPKENAFRHIHGLDDKFVVLYAGNIGLTSCLEDVLAAAEILKNRSDIKIVFVGEGVKKESLAAEARLKNLNNVLFLPYQPREAFAEMLAAADMGLVTLNPAACFSSLPSKTFNVMASARPILAVTPQEGEVARLIRVAECGWNVLPGSPRKLAGVIVELKAQNSLLVQMGKNGRCYLERHYARSRCVDAYEKMLTTLCDQTDIRTIHSEELS